MTKKDKLLFVIPAYNEEENIGKVLKEIKHDIPNADILVINDCSRDRTVDIVKKNKVKCISNIFNMGYAMAVQTGIKYAAIHDYDYVIQFDADGQHLPEYIDVLEHAIKTHDIVIGSRFLDKKKPFSLRMLGSNLISTAIKITTGKALKDPTSGMRAFNKRMIKNFALGLNFGPEPDTVSYLIKRAGANVVEVPVKMAERTAGESYLNLWTSIIYMLRMTISILFIQLIRKRIDGGN